MEMVDVIAKLLQNFEQGGMSRRQLIQGLSLAATAASAAAAGSPITALSVHHITWDVKDHIRCRDFYSDLFGLRVFQGTNTKEVHLQCGETYLTFRGPGARAAAPATTPNVANFGIAVDPWPGPDKEDVSGSPVVVAELKRRGIELKPKGEIRVTDPEGFSVQISGSNWHTKQ
jgi:hypothetical protein